MNTEIEQFNTYYNKIYGFFFRRLNNKSVIEDLTQDTVTDFMMTKTKIRNENAFLYKIARNKLNQHLRNKMSQNKEMALSEYDSASDDSDNDQYKELKEKLQLYLKQLNPNDSEIIELSVMCDFSSKRVAQELGIKPDAARQRLSRSLQKYREILASNNISL